MFEKDGESVLPFVMAGVDGPETNDHTVLDIVPSESVAEAPVGALVVVDKVIALSVPASTTGTALEALTVMGTIALPEPEGPVHLTT